MQIKEFEAYNLKECLQQVKNDLGPEAVILETRKFRKGGLLGWGARDAVCIVAAIGITVQDDLHRARKSDAVSPPQTVPEPVVRVKPTPAVVPTASQVAAVNAARNAYARHSHSDTRVAERPSEDGRPGSRPMEREHSIRPAEVGRTAVAERPVRTTAAAATRERAPLRDVPGSELDRMGLLERTMNEIRESLVALHRENRDGHERTVSAVVSAVAPALSYSADFAVMNEPFTSRFPELHARLIDSGVSEALANELIDDLPDIAAWSEEAQAPLAEAALRDLMARRVPSTGPIQLTPGRLKAVALIGPTGVGKTTTIAKLAAHFALVEGKRVALLTVDTYRIAAVEQLKTYSQIIGIPIGVAYNNEEVLAAITQFADYDLLLIDTAGRSQKNIMQVGELKTLLEAVGCETHLVLSANTKERDLLEAAHRFSAARVDRLIFSKLDETSSYGSLLEVADRAGIPLSYMTTGQKVPEDIEVADGIKLANLLLN